MGVTFEATSRQGIHPQVLTGLAGRLKSSPSASNAEGGGHRASRTKRSAVEARAHCAGGLGMAADEQQQCEQC